jgi:hypothetical protein
MAISSMADDVAVSVRAAQPAALTAHGKPRGTQIPLSPVCQASDPSTMGVPIRDVIGGQQDVTGRSTSWPGSGQRGGFRSQTGSSEPDDSRLLSPEEMLRDG